MNDEKKDEKVKVGLVQVPEDEEELDQWAEALVESIKKMAKEKK